MISNRKQKNQLIKKSYVKHYDINVDILLKIENINKLTTNYILIPYTVTSRKGSMITTECTLPLNSLTREIESFKKLK